MTEHTADLRREEIARPLTPDEEAKFRESVRMIAALPVEDSGLQWTNDAMARLLATLDEVRSQDTATARIAALERNLRQLIDDADTFERAAKAAGVWSENGAAEGITRAIQKYRAVLSGETRTGEHPELRCQRCQQPNVWSWHAPSPLWNAVMRDPATGEDRYSIVCPVCFSQLVEEAGIGQDLDGAPRLVWCFRPDDFDVSALWADPDGRVWDSTRCLWLSGETRNG